MKSGCYVNQDWLLEISADVTLAGMRSRLMSVGSERSVAHPVQNPQRKENPERSRNDVPKQIAQTHFTSFHSVSEHTLMLGARPPGYQ